MREQEIDARVEIARTALNQQIQSLYETYGPGIMNLVVMDTLGPMVQTILLFYPDPDAHEVIKNTLMEVLNDAAQLVTDAMPMSDQDLESLTNSAPVETVN